MDCVAEYFPQLIEVGLAENVVLVGPHPCHCLNVGGQPGIEVRPVVEHSRHALATCPTYLLPVVAASESPDLLARHHQIDGQCLAMMHYDANGRQRLERDLKERVQSGKTRDHVSAAKRLDHRRASAVPESYVFRGTVTQGAAITVRRNRIE